MGRRSLKNVCLSYLSELGGLEIRQLAQTQFRKNENMTDVAGALGVLTHLDCEERETAFVEFENRWRKNTLGAVKCSHPHVFNGTLASGQLHVLDVKVPMSATASTAKC